MGHVVIGHLTIDNIFFEDRKENKLYVPGGAVMYTACGVAMWGGQVSVVSKMGKDYVLYELLKTRNFMGIDTSNIKLVDQPSIILDITYNSAGEHKFIPLRGACTYYDMAPDHEDITISVLKDKLVCHVTPIPVSCQRSIVGAIRNVKGKKRIITLDPDILDIVPEKIELWKLLLQSIDIFILSMTEFERFEHILNIKRKGSVFERISNLQCALLVGNIILKAGSNGAYLLKSTGEKYYIEAIKDDYNDYTGAGDAFAGGVGYALENGYPLEAGLVYGTVAGSVAMKTFGFLHMLQTSNTELNYMLNNIEKKLRKEQ